jgi:pyridoxal 5'-phosphate synthase pdxT subunit
VVTGSAVTGSAVTGSAVTSSAVTSRAVAGSAVTGSAVRGSAVTSRAVAGRASPPVGVLALQGDVAEHLRALRESGARPSPVRRPEELDRVEGLVIPGGESTTIWKLIEIFGLADQLRKRIADGMPAFGSCAGMILLADRLRDPASGQQTLGGIDMTVRRNAFGRQLDSFERNLDVAGIGAEPYRAVFIRAPWVEQAGPRVDILATDPGASRIVAVREGPVLATAFHPELTPDRRIHQMFVEIVRERS